MFSLVHATQLDPVESKSNILCNLFYYLKYENKSNIFVICGASTFNQLIIRKPEITKNGSFIDTCL